MVHFSQYRRELLQLLDEDQREVRACSKAYRRAPRSSETKAIRTKFAQHAASRVQRALEILHETQDPTIQNLGTDGSQALSVLALHARLGQMKEILAAFELSYQRDGASVYHEAIPSLVDRVLILEGKRQRFGTQWMLGSDGRFFLPPVEDFHKINERRARYGLGKSVHPIDLTNGIPEVEPARPVTQEDDQREPTKQEYDDFAYGSLD